MMMKWKIVNTIECGNANATAIPKTLFPHN